MADEIEEVAAEGSAAVKIVDAYPEAETLLEHGVARLSAEVVASLRGQVESATAEVAAFEKLNAVATAEYAAVKDDLTDLDAYLTSLQQQSDALRPFVAKLDELEAAVADLEGLTSALSAQSKQMEAAVAEALA